MTSLLLLFFILPVLLSTSRCFVDVTLCKVELSFNLGDCWGLISSGNRATRSFNEVSHEATNLINARLLIASKSHSLSELFAFLLFS